MKKILVFLTVFCLIFAFASCGKENSAATGVDIEYYAKLGQIPECRVFLGDTDEDVKTKLESDAAESDSQHSGYETIEGENNVLISDGTHEYYYKKSDNDQKIGYMVSYDDAYGFKIGDVILTVKESLKNYEYSEEKIGDDTFFFMGNPNEAEVLKLTFKKYVVLFLFQNNELCATAIYDSEAWN